MWALLLLAGCERDPTLFGYWEIVSLRVGPSEEDADEVTDAGFMEFASNNTCTAMFSYTWSGMELAPDPRPDLEFYSATLVSSTASHDLFDSWVQKDEAYTVTMGEAYSEALSNTFDLEDWAGSSATLVSDEAIPPGPWHDQQETRMYVAMGIER